MRVYILLLSLIASQVGFTQSDFTGTLTEMQLEFLQPVEQKPSIIASGKIKYFDYDFGLDLDGGNTKVLVQTKKDDGNYIPQVMISALVATLATNDQDVEISMTSPNDNYLKETNSDWAIEALFTPKSNLGDYKIAYLKSIFKENVGITNILYLAKTDLNTQPVLRYID